MPLQAPLTGDISRESVGAKHEATPDVDAAWSFEIVSGEEHTKLALNSAKVGVWSWTKGRGEMWASEKTWELFGWPPNSKLNHVTLLNPIHPEDRENFQRQMEQAMREPADYQAEFRVLLPDGSMRWIKNLGRSYSGAKGAPERIIGVSLDITARKCNEQALIEQLKFETLLAELSAVFINLPAGQVYDKVEEAQKRICEALGLERSALVQVTADGDVAIVKHSWTAEGGDPPPRLPLQEFPWIVRTVLGGQGVSFARLDDLPVEAAKDKESLSRYGFKSSAAFPLSVGGKMIGAVAFGSVRGERNWPAPLVDRLNLMAHVFANALARAEADEKLRQAYHEIGELKQRLEKENRYLREDIKLEHHHHEVIGDCKCIQRVLKKTEQVAGTEATVLLLGETGTGKELIARTIHEHSRRKGRVMVKVNCAALPASLIESELFGREKGAYTGALTREIGRFELANGSTILLDEIAELPLELQSKLLRVLQEGEFERLGSPRTIKVDVRVIASTSRNLQEAVREGRFREDLFYRLNIFPITIPPLRERREDIPALVWHFVNDLGQRMGRSIETIQGSTMEAFKRYYWPGNVRELRNMIERFLITSTDTVFRAKLPTFEAASPRTHPQTFEEVERHHILHVMELVGWRVRGEGGAAQLLGLKPTTLESRMQKLGILRRK
ncbi:MAG: sigma 54-interacting transcriptional regulator [Candidatus Acidiferrum sp.]